MEQLNLDEMYARLGRLQEQLEANALFMQDMQKEKGQLMKKIAEHKKHEQKSVIEQVIADSK